MPETKPTLSLHRKLAQIMYEAERIPKNGTGPKEQGSYPFVRAGDAADYIRKALAEKIITMMPTSVQVTGQVDRPTARGGVMTTVDLLTEWTLTDGESGETLTIMSFGAGADTGDKYSGKASTSAMKYALLTGFLLSTGDDTENHDTSDQRARQSQVPQGAPAAAQAAADEAARAQAPVVQPPPTLLPDGGLIGTAIAQGQQDFNLRQSPDDGWALPFRIKNGQSSFIVIAEDALAEAIDKIKPQILDKRVTVWGRWTDETTPVKDTKPTIHYKVLRLERIATADFILPAPAFDSSLPQPPEDVSLVGEAPTAPLFDDVAVA